MSVDLHTIHIEFRFHSMLYIGHVGSGLVLILFGPVTAHAQDFKVSILGMTD